MAEVASAFVTLIPSFRGGSAAISKQFDGAADSAGKKSGRRFGGGMAVGLGGIATKVFAPLAAVAGAAGLASFFSDAVGAASDLNEAATKTEAIFGKAGAAAVDAFASKGAKALGQTKLEVVNAAATFGTFGKAAGKSGQDLAKFSTGFASLSTDLASFYNTSPEEAVTAIGAALRGESEPIRQYGVLLDDATLRQEALKLGLIETTKQALTPQQKVLAAQAAIYKQTKDAQGDFQKTSGGLANQQRILTAQFADFKATVGQALLPVVTRFVTFLNDQFVPGIKAVGDFFKPVTVAVGQFFNSAGSGPSKFAPLVEFFQGRFLPALQGVIGAFRQYLSVVIPIVQQFVAGMRARIEPLLPTIREIFTQIGAVITDVMGLVKTVIQFATTQVSGIWNRWGSGLMSFIAKIFGNVLTIIKGALGVVRGVIKTVTSLIKGDWSGVWAGIKQIVSGAWQVIKGVVSGALNIIKGVLSGAWSVIRSVAAGAWDRIKSAISSRIDSLVSFVRSIPGRVTSAIGDLGSLLYRKGQQLIDGLINGIKSKIQAVGQAAAQVGQKIKDFFPGSPVKSGPLRSWNNGGAGKRLGDMLASGLESSTSSVRAASASLAASVASPSSSAAFSSGDPFGSSSRLDLSEATLHRLAALLSGAPLNATVSASSIDRALAGGLF